MLPKAQFDNAWVTLYSCSVDEAKFKSNPLFDIEHEVITCYNLILTLKR